MPYPDAERYAAAWCAHSTDALLEFYAPEARSIINDGEAVEGRAAIGEMMQEFMDAFPDLVVKMEGFRSTPSAAIFVWRLLGTHAATGRLVDLEGWEAWRLRPDGLISQMRGCFDAENYARQIGER